MIAFTLVAALLLAAALLFVVPPLLRARRAAAAVALLVPAAAVLVYATAGNFGALESAQGVQQPAHAVSAEQVGAMVDRLAERLRQSPDDVEGWSMLARSSAALGRYRQSAQAYAELVKLAPGNAGVLADYADMLAMAQGRKLAGEPFELVKQALAIDPRHLKSLALAGSAELERQNFKAAAAYWERILPLVPEDSDFARSIRASLAQTRKPAAAGAAITGVVRLAPEAAARVSPDDTLFVFARPAQGGPPVAIVRAKAKQLPYEFRLDDSQAMAPGMQLSAQGKVIVGARISRSGNATPQPGDLHAASRPVAPGTSALELLVSQAPK